MRRIYRYAKRLLVIAAVALCMGWLLGLVRPGARMTVALERAGAAVDGVVERTLGEEAMLRQRTLRTLAGLHAEADRLMWIDAEASIAAERLGKTTAGLALQWENGSRNLYVATGALHAGKAVVTSDGRTMAGAELEAWIKVQQVQVEGLGRQLSIYRQSEESYRGAARRAYLLRSEVDQGIGTLQACLALLESAMVAKEEGLAVGGGGRSVRAGVDALEGEIARRQEIQRAREVLEKGLSFEQAEVQTPLPPVSQPMLKPTQHGATNVPTR